jgi:hypothetical protein
VLEECIVSNAEVGMFSPVGLSRSLAIRRMSSTTEDTPIIIRSFFSVAFHASRSEMAIIFGVPILFTVCTLNNISFVFGRFEFYFALLYVLYIDYVLVIGDRLEP